MYGYVLPKTVLQPVAATMPIESGPWTWRVAATSIRIAVASPQPAHEPGAADVAEGVLAEHQVGERLLVAVLGGVGGSERKKRMSRA